METINGFVNSSSICYFNSLLQSLLSCVHIVKKNDEKKNDEKKNDEKKNDEKKNDDRPKNKLETMFYDFCLNEKKDTYFSSQFLKILLEEQKGKNNNFSGQQSASEFFMFLIDKMKLDDIFLHEYAYVTTCCKCKNTSTHIDKMIDAKIFFEENKDIFDSINIKDEEITGYTCDSCKEKTTATISRSIKNLPSVFCVNFTNKYSNSHPCLYYPVSFETSTHTKYHLVASIEHFGNINSGHFSSRVRRGNDCFIVDDMSVAKINDIVSDKNTYMLFYEKQLSTNN